MIIRFLLYQGEKKKNKEKGEDTSEGEMGRDRTAQNASCPLSRRLPAPQGLSAAFARYPGSSRQMARL